MAASHVTDIFGSVLAGQPVRDADLQRLIQVREPEDLYLEYKRGKWLDANRASGHEIRRYVSGFANAEGGLLIIGIVGGEDAQGPAQWSIEGPACPSSSGWTAWLSHVVEPIAARTRVRWQVVSVGGQDVVLIAVDRGEALIQVYEKPTLVCYLRIGEQTIAIDGTLFADLALGRRVRPDLELDAPEVQVGRDSSGLYVNVSVVLHNHGLVWVPDVRAIWVGYSFQPVKSREPLNRYLDVRPLATPDRNVKVTVTEFNASDNGLPGRAELPPFQQTQFRARVERLPVPEEPVVWAWSGAVAVVPKNGAPLWAQIAVQGKGIEPTRSLGWVPAKGTAPVVAWLWNREAPSTLETIFGDALP